VHKRLTLEKDNIEKLREEISTLIKEEIKKSQKEIKEKLDIIVEKFNPLLEEYEVTPPYEKLADWSQGAINQIKKDIAIAIEESDDKKEKKARKKAQQIDKMINEVIRLTEKIREEESQEKQFSNPLYPKPTIAKIPLIGKIPISGKFRGHGRGTINWLGLLLTGMGLGILGSGVWSATEHLFSIQGSIIIGLIIILLTAWLARRKVFALFGQE
jgi:hypothetical protein